MKFFRPLFSGRNNDKSETRQLDHPRDLQPGDVLKFGFMPAIDVSNGEFAIKAINTYDTATDQKPKTVFSLEGVAGEFFLAVLEQSGREILEIGRHIFPDDVEAIFDIDAFGAVLSSEGGTQHILNRHNEPQGLMGWTAPVYYQEAGVEGYFYAGDFREKALSDSADGYTAFDYYLLVSPDRSHGIQMEVYDGGRTEVTLQCYLPVGKVEEMWPLGAK